MYPVISMLRRAAGTVVYIRQEHTTLTDGRLAMQVDRATAWANLETEKWESTSTEIPLFQLIVTASSSEDAAYKLTIKENDLSEKIKAADLLYTLILGPETETCEDGVYTRTFRAGVVRGFFRHPRDAVVLKTVPPKERQRATYRRLPSGVIHERR